MKSLLLVLFVCVASMAITMEEVKTKFVEFRQKYNKVYSSREEMQTKFQIFTENMEISERLTALNKGSATFGVGPFADISKEEFARTHLMPNMKRNHPRPPAKTVFPHMNYSFLPGGPDPNNYDWSSAGVITPVYDQGQCGSCWAFSATETIESYFALAGNTLTQLSMEQICDCDTTDQGCNGGNTQTAYQYVEQQGGLDSYANYPYTAGDGQTNNCEFPQGNVVAVVSNYNSVSGESGLYGQASTAGPVSVCVDASSWQNYNGGILTSCGDSIDHCVELTGYQNYDGSQGTPAWNVRNSWGTSWGQNGYILIAIGQDLCGIGDDATIVSAST